MYFADKNGLMWMKTDNGFQNIGVAVKEKLVTFKRVESVEIVPSPLVVPSIEDGIPLTLRQAISKFSVTEDNPLQPLNNLEV